MCKQFLVNSLKKFADTTFTQPFYQVIPGTSDSLLMTNILGVFYGKNDSPLLLGAHWDTRPTAEHDKNPSLRKEPIIGANDGASGIAVLLEIANILSKNKPTNTIYIVFFDAEDLGIEGNPRSYALGSQYFSRNMPFQKPNNAIILDMVGDADLYLPIERNSYRQNPELVKKLWTMAEELNLEAFDKQLMFEIYDDHVPLWEEAGIPAIDIIDFMYPNKTKNYWHTHQDTPENCSPNSLYQVGTLVTSYIFDL